MSHATCRCEGLFDDEMPALGQSPFRFCNGSGRCGYVFDRQQQRWRFCPGLDLDDPPDPEHLQIPSVYPYSFGWVGDRPRRS